MKQKSNSALQKDPTYTYFKCLLEHITQIIPQDDCLSIYFKQIARDKNYHNYKNQAFKGLEIF